MRQYYYRTILPLFLLIVVVSQQGGTSVKTHVDTTAQGGTSEVNVQTNVNTSNSDSTVYRRVETNVNGVKEVYESTEPGSKTIKVTSDSTNGTKVQVENQVGKDGKETPSPGTKIMKSSDLQDIEQKPIPYAYSEGRLHEYIIGLIKNLFEKIFSAS